MGAAERTGSIRSTILEAQATSRVEELVPIRYGRMLASPFAFYRGGAAIMAYDLSATPKTGIQVQACGDAHISNFGVFASPERALLFDVNDFDETLPGPVGMGPEAAGGKHRDRRTHATGSRTRSGAGVLLHVAAGYRNAMSSFATMRDLEVWYSRLAIQDGLPLVRKNLDKRNAEDRRLDRRQGPNEEQHAGLRAPHDDGRRATPHRERPALDRLDG